MVISPTVLDTATGYYWPWPGQQRLIEDSTDQDQCELTEDWARLTDESPFWHIAQSGGSGIRRQLCPRQRQTLCKRWFSVNAVSDSGKA